MHGQATFLRPSKQAGDGRSGRVVPPLRCFNGQCRALGAGGDTTGSVEAKPQGGDTRSHCIEAFREVILGAVQAQKDISLVELTEMLRTGHKASFAASTVWRFLDRHGMTFKKTAPAAEQERADVAERHRPGSTRSLTSTEPPGVHR